MNKSIGSTAAFPQATGLTGGGASSGGSDRIQRLADAIRAEGKSFASPGVLDRLQSRLPDFPRDELRAAVLAIWEEIYREEAERIRPAAEAYQAEVAFKRGWPVEVPIGGTTGLDHQTSAAIDEAAGWLLSETLLPTEIVPALRVRFGLSFEEAASAIRDAHRRRKEFAQ